MRHGTFALVLVTLSMGCEEPTSAVPASRGRPRTATPVGMVGPATQRPIGDFLGAQGTFCLPDGAGGCLLVDPPVPNFIMWRDDSELCLSIDYAGVAKAWVERVSNGTMSLPTRIDGTITEQPMDDGSTEVRVRLQTTGALAWAGDCLPGGTVYFGHRAPNVLAGAQPALGESTLTLVFINHAPGAPLPDLIKMLVFPEPTQELRSITFRATATGTLRAAYGVAEGTPGKAQVILVSLTGTSAPGAGVPVSRVDLHVLAP